MISWSKCRQMGKRKTMEQLRNLVFVSVISADNDEFGLSEDDKQEIMRRSKLGSQSATDKHSSSTNGDIIDWDYVFEPIADEKKRRMLVELFEESDID